MTATTWPVTVGKNFTDTLGLSRCSLSHPTYSSANFDTITNTLHELRAVTWRSVHLERPIWAVKRLPTAIGRKASVIPSVFHSPDDPAEGQHTESCYCPAFTPGTSHIPSIDPWWYIGKKKGRTGYHLVRPLQIDSCLPLTQPQSSAGLQFLLPAAGGF